MTWIVIRNWERHQHYGDRNPPWIKLYLALLHDDDFQNLTPTDRATLVELWILYAVTHSSIQKDTKKISRACGHRVTNATLQRLNDAGFIAFSASRPASTEKRRDREEREIKKENKNLLADLAPTGPAEPPVDPQALERIRELSARISRRIDDDTEIDW